MKIRFKIISILRIILLSIFVSSCVPKPWPTNSLEEIKNGLGDEWKMVKLLSGSNNDSYPKCVLSKYKSQYPNYADFEEAAVKNPQKIKEMRISCIKSHVGNDFNRIWNYIEDNDNIINLKNKLHPNYFVKYKECMMFKLRTEFHTLDNFIDKSTFDQVGMSNFIKNADNECGQEILSDIRNEENHLAELNSLFDDNLDAYGYLYFKNNASKKITVAVAYFYYGKKWEGWVSSGWYNFLPGEKGNIKIPLNKSGYLPELFYYCARMTDSSNWSWSGNTSFIVMNEAFTIPNADKSDNLKSSLKFYLNSNFKEHHIKENSRIYTLEITE